MSEATTSTVIATPPIRDAMLAPTRILRASWSSTLRLPKSSFPARPSPTTKAEYLRRCTDDLYKWQRSEDRFNGWLKKIRANPYPYAITTAEDLKGPPPPTTFTLHDGPPYANGPLHIGHALNKITKDMICRFEVGQGKKVSYIPGWDCHGLPIEIKALQAQKQDAAQSNPVSIRKAARKLATRTVEEQMRGFNEWAVMGDWDNAYKTMERGFELRQLDVFKTMFEKGLIYRQNKPVHWSPSSRTALAEAELEYDENHKSLAAFVRFPVQQARALKHDKLQALEEDLGMVVWTTTPWTLPANSAIAVHNNMEYCVVRDTNGNGDLTLVATSRVVEYEKVLERSLDVVVSGLRGTDLAGNFTYENPFQKARGVQQIIHADFVSDSSGTGLVHMAAGHGMDDYNVCHALGLPAFAPLDDTGAFTKEAFPERPELLTGLLVADEQKSGSNAVCDYLEQQGLLRKRQNYVHKYPIDWRTKQPVITRATEQWFANVESIKEASMKAISGVQFLPETGRSRLESFIQGRSQWCISRQRAWGVPIPALYKVKGDKLEATMDSKTIEHIRGVIEERGIDAWWTDAQDDPVWKPPHLEGTYVRGRDTMDVWFDSGTSWTLLPAKVEEPVADVYLEGTDQHRGWFQSSLLTHVATQNYSLTPVRPPYKTLITHGFTLDSEGRKMSKSLGNVISPSQIMSGELLPPIKRKKQKGASKSNTQVGTPAYDSMGSDALRLWAASSDYTRDVTIGQPVLQSVNQALHKYRVTFKWLLGIFSLPSCPPDFTSFTTLYEEENSIVLADRLAMDRLGQINNEVHAFYQKYEFFKGVNTINKYIANDLSASYFETLKDRIYTGDREDCQIIQRILGIIFYELLQMLAPIVPLLVEEVWAYVPEKLRENSVHPAHNTWKPLPLVQSSDIANTLAALSTSIKASQELLRTNKHIGSSLESSVTIYLSLPALHELQNQYLAATDPEMDSPDDIQSDLASFFVVSNCEIRVLTHSNGDIHFGDLEEKDKQELLDRQTSQPDLLHFETGRPEEITKDAVWFEENVVPAIDGETGVLPYGARVLVHPPKGGKCPRCWRFAKGEEEEICRRCDDVVKESKDEGVV